MSRSGAVKGSVVSEYPSGKEQRHEFFTKRKRMQESRADRVRDGRED